jgi:hypothetical protein
MSIPFSLFEERNIMAKRRQKSERSKQAVKPFEHQPEFRALTLYESLPPGYATFLVTDDGSEPHLKPGEYAVIDQSDRELQHGEVYLIQYHSGRRRRYLRVARSSYCNITGPNAEESLVWWLNDLRGWRNTGKRVHGVPLFAGLTDGPFLAEALQQHYIAGRVVGFALTSLGNRIEREAGWHNEDAGNAAFDPAEYVNVLIATGHRPYVYNDSYFEEMPDNALSDEQTNAVFAVRRKYCEASTARERVMAECLKRGLVHGRRAA